MLRDLLLKKLHGPCRVRSVERCRYLFVTVLMMLISIFVICPLYSEPVQTDRIQDIVNTSTFTRIQKPIIVRSDRKTLEYFIEHVEELAKYGRDLKKGELKLEVKGNNRYEIQIPEKHITGEFELAEREPNKAVYLGHGNARSFINFAGEIVLEVNYTTEHDEKGNYENVATIVHLKFDNGFLAVLAKAASPLITSKLDKLIAKFSKKTKNIVEAAYTNKE